MSFGNRSWWSALATRRRASLGEFRKQDRGVPIEEI